MHVHLLHFESKRALISPNGLSPLGHLHPLAPTGTPTGFRPVPKRAPGCRSRQDPHPLRPAPATKLISRQLTSKKQVDYFRVILSNNIHEFFQENLTTSIYSGGRSLPYELQVSRPINLPQWFESVTKWSNRCQETLASYNQFECSHTHSPPIFCTHSPLHCHPAAK